VLKNLNPEGHLETPGNIWLVLGLMQRAGAGFLTEALTCLRGEFERFSEWGAITTPSFSTHLGSTPLMGAAAVPEHLTNT